VSSDRLAQTDDVSAADWIAPRLGAFGSGVGGIIPAGFEAYARVLHPADSADEHARWSSVAATTGKVAHALMQFHALVGVGPYDYDVDTAEWTGTVPDQGDLEPESLAALLEVLARHMPAQRCWFAVWEGHGWLPGGSRSRVTFVATSDGTLPPAATKRHFAAVDYDARVELPQRNYLLFGGPLAAALEIGDWPTAQWFLPHSPNIFWPDDRSWCVATEIDLFCTYVGGSRALIDDLLADERLEVWEAHLDDPVTYDSDLLNS
jgi:hypothetical protein